MTALSTADDRSRFTTALERHVSGPVAEDGDLIRLGLDSLALIRIVVEVAGDDPDRDLDLGEVLELRTVAELRRWLTGGPVDTTPENTAPENTAPDDTAGVVR